MNRNQANRYIYTRLLKVYKQASIDTCNTGILRATLYGAFLAITNEYKEVNDNYSAVAINEMIDTILASETNHRCTNQMIIPTGE
jgi:hypothetical protein